MHNLHLRNLLSALALSALLPLSLTACDDGGGSGSGSGDSSTGGSDSNDSNDAASATVTVTDTTPTTVTDTTPTTGDSDPTTGVDTTDTEATTGDTEATTGDTEATTGDTEATTGDTEEPTTGGMSECEMLTVDSLGSFYNGLQDVWVYGQDGELTGGMEPDSIQVRFWNVGDGPVQAGDVDLTAPPNDDIFACETCVVHFEDLDDQGDHTRLYFQSMGTLGVSESVDTLTSELTFTNVRLVETEIDMDGNPSVVEDGQCIDIVDTTASSLPAGWTCAPEAYADGDVCDCGCGFVDPDCADESASSCDACNGDGSCAADGADCSTIVADDNAICTIEGWNCDPTYYGADDGCDCGCGIADPDCAGDMTLDICEYCSGTGSCSDQVCDGNTQIDPTDNAVCL